MRILMEVNFPHEPFNSCVRDGTAGQKIEKVMEELRPQSIYFTERGGHRGCVAIVDVPNAARIPALAEPFFLYFNADVHMRIAMTPDELKKAELTSLGKRWAD